jgi:hypothetical protein
MILSSTPSFLRVSPLNSTLNSARVSFSWLSLSLLLTVTLLAKGEVFRCPSCQHVGSICKRQLPAYDATGYRLNCLLKACLRKGLLEESCESADLNASGRQPMVLYPLERLSLHQRSSFLVLERIVIYWSQWALWILGVATICSLFYVSCSIGKWSIDASVHESF